MKGFEPEARHHCFLFCSHIFLWAHSHGHALVTKQALQIPKSTQMLKMQ